MEPYTTKRGDTAKPLRAPLEDEDGPCPLFGATITFIMEQVGGSKLVTGVATAVNAAAVYPDPDAGWVQYLWRLDGSDTNVAGIFRGVFKVVFGNGRIEHFPSDGHIEIRIRDTPGP